MYNGCLYLSVCIMVAPQATRRMAVGFALIACGAAMSIQHSNGGNQRAPTKTWLFMAHRHLQAGGFRVRKPE